MNRHEIPLKINNFSNKSLEISLFVMNINLLHLCSSQLCNLLHLAVDNLLWTLCMCRVCRNNADAALYENSEKLLVIGKRLGMQAKVGGGHWTSSIKRKKKDREREKEFTDGGQRL